MFKNFETSIPVLHTTSVPGVKKLNSLAKQNDLILPHAFFL